MAQLKSFNTFAKLFDRLLAFVKRHHLRVRVVLCSILCGQGCFIHGVWMVSDSLCCS